MTTPTDDLVDVLAQLSFLVQGALAEATGDHDLSIVQVRLLGILRDREPTMNELGAHLRLDKSSITGLVDRAERRGLVRRTASSRDRRAVEVSITETGRHLADQVSARFGDRMAVITARLTEAERARLAALAGRLLASDALPAPSVTSRRRAPAE